MADFQQQGPITTLHRLVDSDGAEVSRFFDQRDVGKRVALIMPCLISEFDGPALPLSLCISVYLSFCLPVCLSFL